MDRQLVTAMIGEVRRERAELARRLADLEFVETRLLGWVTPAGGPSSQGQAGEGGSDSTVQSAPGFAPGATQADAAEQVLRERGPASVPAIVDLMLDRGFGIGGPADSRRRRLCDSVAAALRKRPTRFRKIGPGLWDVVRQQVEPAATTQESDAGSC